MIRPRFRAGFFAIVFLFGSFVNVRMRVEALEEPKNCLQSKAPCAILIEKRVDLTVAGALSVRAIPGSSFKIESNQDLDLVRGLFLVRANGAGRVRTRFGEFKFSEGEILVNVEDSIVNVTNLSADLKYHPRGEVNTKNVNIDYHLPAGYSTYLSGITSAGVAQVGYPRPAEIEKLIKTWSRFYSAVESKEFQAQVKDFSRVWKKATDLASQWYRATYDEAIVKHNQEMERQERLRAAREKEANQWKDMIRQRNLIGVDPGETHDPEQLDRRPASQSLDDIEL